jgi:hypothetical protein
MGVGGRWMGVGDWWMCAGGRWMGVGELMRGWGGACVIRCACMRGK